MTHRPVQQSEHTHTYLGDEVELVHIVLAGEEGLAAQQLSHDAANRPGTAQGSRAGISSHTGHACTQGTHTGQPGPLGGLDSSQPAKKDTGQLAKLLMGTAAACPTHTKWQGSTWHAHWQMCCTLPLARPRQLLPATPSPHVYGCRVVVAAQQQLRCTVPAGHHILSHANLVLSTVTAEAQTHRHANAGTHTEDGQQLHR